MRRSVMERPFNPPQRAGRERGYVDAAIASGKLSGDGELACRCAARQKQAMGSKRALVTPSCIAARGIAALLAQLQSGDRSSYYDGPLASMGRWFAKLASQLTSLFRGAANILMPDGQKVTAGPVYTYAQNRTRRALMGNDRRQHARTPDAYAVLARATFTSIRIGVHHDMLKIPYSYRALGSAQSRVESR